MAAPSVLHVLASRARDIEQKTWPDPPTLVAAPSILRVLVSQARVSGQKMVAPGASLGPSYAIESQARDSGRKNRRAFLSWPLVRISQSVHSDQTANAFPTPSEKWKRLPPGNSNVGTAMLPPAATIAASVAFKSLE